MFKRLILIIFLFICVHLFSQKKEKLPVFAFHGVPPGQYSTKDQFTTMKKAGIDICYTLFNNNEEVLRALDAAQEAGVKLVIKVETLFSDTERTVKLLKNHPALYGYCLLDEPPPSKFDELAKIVREIRKYDSNHITYINLFPNYVGKDVIDGYSYREYLDLFLQKVPVEFLSFDHYPIVNNEVRGDWYQNLETVRDICLKNKINFWAFANSTIHYNYLQPTIEGIRLQQFSNLLYGAQGLQYFAYWTLTYEYNWRKEKYGYSIVDDKGNPTPTYSVVKTVNEEIQRLAWVFLGAKSNAIFHTGDRIPQGTKRLFSIPNSFSSFSTKGGEALISYMSNGNNEFIIIQNKSLHQNLYFSYKLKLSLRKVNNDTGKTISLLTKRRHSDTILPGDVLIFTYKK
ncbi:hypothetical protein [Chryseobacterium gossypii]|uniref:hypothetical protein n=1 Tax=Chryseobacterium gossypii TaxID=3231602 RepID=UPI003525A6DB